MEKVIGKVVGIVVALFVTGILLPVGLEQLLGASIEGAGTTIDTLVHLFIPAIATIGIALLFVKSADLM